MTREEAAIKSCEDRIKHLKSAPTHHYGKRQRERAIELEKVKIKALRPVSREMVEKVFPGCKHCTKQKVPFCNDGASDSVYLLTGNGLAAIESDSWEFLVSYCPNCGRPLTDEAVEIRLKELEALYGDR